MVAAVAGRTLGARLTATPFVRHALSSSNSSRVHQHPSDRRKLAANGARWARALFSGPDGLAGGTVEPIKAARAVLSIGSAPHQRSITQQPACQS